MALSSAPTSFLQRELDFIEARGERDDLDEVVIQALKDEMIKDWALLDEEFENQQKEM